MEIITYILSGSLAHKDSLGSGETIRPGDVQHMTAGSGIRHSEFNPSKAEPVHLLQIWLKPGERDLKPVYDQVHFSEEARRDQLRLVASPDGADGSIKIFQDVRLFASLLSPDRVVRCAIGPGRYAWVQVARGSVKVNGTALAAGDAAAVSEERELRIEGTSDSEFLLFDLA
jgi:redox-sensitive bicupin YhaK (pirin superfamily)